MEEACVLEQIWCPANIQLAPRAFGLIQRPSCMEALFMIMSANPEWSKPNRPCHVYKDHDGRANEYHASWKSRHNPELPWTYKNVTLLTVDHLTVAEAYARLPVQTIIAPRGIWAVCKRSMKSWASDAKRKCGSETRVYLILFHTSSF